jgi:hypothetical protein
MFINEGLGKLRRVTEGAFVTRQSPSSNSIALKLVDIDGDDDMDVLVAVSGCSSGCSSKNAMYTNDGAGALTKVTVGAFVTDDGDSRSGPARWSG